MEELIINKICDIIIVALQSVEHLGNFLDYVW